MENGFLKLIVFWICIFYDCNCNYFDIIEVVEWRWVKWEVCVVVEGEMLFCWEVVVEYGWDDWDSWGVDMERKVVKWF